MKRVWCMLDDPGLPKKYWTFALPVVVYLKNRTLTNSMVGKTACEAWDRSGKRPSRKHLLVFGCLAFMHFSKEKWKKHDCRPTPGIIVWYSLSTKQYFIYDPFAMMHHCSQDVVFSDAKWYTAPNAADEAIVNKYFNRSVTETPKSTPTKKESETSQQNCRWKFWTSNRVAIGQWITS